MVPESEASFISKITHAEYLMMLPSSVFSLKNLTSNSVLQYNIEIGLIL